jgi:TPR repeat protein
MRASRHLIWLAATLALPGIAWADVAAGITAWKAGDYPAAVAEWTGPAEAGDAEAQVRLAEAYLTGRGVPVDAAKARDLLEKAAAQGQPLAEVNLGLVLFRDGETGKAFPLLEKAAARGEPRAQYVLGTALFNGDRITRDRVRGYTLMTKSAASGLPQARTSMTRMESLLTPAQRKAIAALTGVTPSAGSTATAPAAGWKVQLGAFGSRAAAETLWTKLSAQPAFAAVAPVYVPVNSVTRLQAGPFKDRAGATAACEAAKSAGQDCFPLQP